jgi:cob(I)alamin adenosyltransferase
MGNRLSKIYTRTGDDGTTGTADGRRVAKDSVLMEAIGTLDELNCQLGVLLSLALPQQLSSLLNAVQHQLFNIGAEVSGSANFRLLPAAVTELEAILDEHNRSLPPLREFVLPGGSAAAASCHLARAICRRAERRLLSWSQQQQNINPELLRYLNRLSDLLFVLARVLVHSAGREEVYWRNPRDWS